MDEIKNIPSYAHEYRYIVYRVVDGIGWFYGAYNELDRALMTAGGINGKIKEVKNA